MENNTFSTIKELYEWAKKNGYENYKVYTSEEGCLIDLYISDICINKKNKEIVL